MENSLVPSSGVELAIMPVMNVQMAVERRKQITEFIKQIMKPGTDFGIIPGTGDKPALLKPGAEKLTTLFGLTKKFTILEKVEDWDGSDHSGESFFYYIYRCGLYRGDMLIAEADGSYNSHESKYRYRKAERICPNCGQPAIIKGKAEYGGGWLCYAKKGGCGAKFKAGDPAIESQEVGRVFNPDVADQANTLLKMAQKRALVAATLLAINGSEYFSTKEMPGVDEDDAPPTDAEWWTDPEANPAVPAAKKQEAGNGGTGNGHAEKPFKFPNKTAEKFFDAVQQATGNYYENGPHLLQVIGGWFNFGSEDLWNEKLSLAVDHARQKRQTEPVEVESQAVQDEIPF